MWFTFRTDHYELQWIPNMTKEKEKLAMVRLKLLKLDFEAVHPIAVKNQAADAFSRLATTGMDESQLEDDVRVLMIAEAKPEGKRQKQTQNLAKSSLK